MYLGGIAKILQPVVWPIVAVAGGRVWVIFNDCLGNKASKKGNDITLQCYDPASTSWVFKSPYPHTAPGTWGASAVGMDNKVFVVGGFRKNCTMYDVVTDAWSLLSTPSKPHGWGAATIMNNSIYLFGGMDGDDWDSIETYNVSTDEWAVSESNMPVGLQDLHVVLLKV